MKKNSPLLLFIVFLIGGSLFFFWQKTSQISFPQETEKELARAQKNKDSLRSIILSSTKEVSLIDIEHGFWYSYTNERGEEVFVYFSLEDFAKLSEEQITSLSKVFNHSSFHVGRNFSFKKNEDLPHPLQLHNALYGGVSYAGGTKNTQEILGLYEQKIKEGSATFSDYSSLAYIYEFLGFYNKRDVVKKDACKKFPPFCKDKVPKQFILQGVVKEKNGGVITGAEVSLLGRQEILPVKTNEKGEYSFSVTSADVEKFRVQATYEGYSEGGSTSFSFGSIDSNKNMYSVPPIEIARSRTSLLFDTRTIRGKKELFSDGLKITIPENSIKDEAGNIFYGEALFYVYNFTKETIPEGLVTNDIFSEGNYEGDKMITAGMPYFQLRDASEKKELFIYSDNPLLIRYTVPHFKEILNPTDKNITPVSLGEIKRLVEVSKQKPLSLTADVLTSLKSAFPPWWIFDQKTGVWDNVGMSLLDESGLTEAPFYTTKLIIK